MTKQNLNNTLIMVLTVLTLFCGCRKDFLDAKPSSDIVIPSSLGDFQQLMDNSLVCKVPALPILSCDDYYILSEADWSSLFTSTERESYIWSKDVYGGEVARQDWILPYTGIFYTNSVINGLANIPITEKNRAAYNYIKGQAYFARAFTYFELAKSFAHPYDIGTASTELGVPLKLSPDIDEIKQRATLSETYQQILEDLNKATVLLPSVITASRNRGNKPAAYALFARIYLSMRQYEKAEVYADSCLGIYNKLIDYNSVSKTATNPFTNTNDETMFWATHVSFYGLASYNSTANTNVDSTLIRSYAADDLRRSLYFIANGSNLKFKRGYSANANSFAGLATDEMYLIKAECLARRNEYQAAMVSLNNLLIKRFTTGKFIPYTASSQAEALNKILTERRKELVWRGSMRWDDLRRLNQEGASINLTRRLGNNTYTLSPNSLRYTFPIPSDEIALSGIEQNIR
ncbi:RagB/SusD family nutrient uptake outer membrane protein [Pedobacter psychrodurus]|uniref:RagB/SusD family nutrient uptake outer membrane protein n=1 Tax=Pedobacter psychrodurus TaxID=2530456 RepID=UPI00292E6497|nr:RagB/SusD family nutrient uptake outer membrane protein [Pedobacter psychrodurus]